MTAVSDTTTILTILKGSVPTNQQMAKVVDLYKSYLTVDNPTQEQRARAFLDGLKDVHRKKIRANAEQEVYSEALAQAHFPADQPALIASVKDEAEAAGDAAEGGL